MHLQISPLNPDLKSDLKSREVRGYASIFNLRDLAGDVVLPGAFAESIGRNFRSLVAAGKPPRVHFLYQHDHGRPVGTITELREDNKGLYFTARIARTQLGDELLELVYNGTIDGLSIGYRILEEDYDSVRRARLLRKVDLLEISAVTFPANEECRLKGELLLKSVAGIDSIANVFEQAVPKFADMIDEIVCLKKKFAGPVNRQTSMATAFARKWDSPTTTDFQREHALKMLREELALQLLLSGRV